MDEIAKGSPPENQPMRQPVPDDNVTPMPGEVFWPTGPLIGSSGQQGTRFNRTVRGVIRCAWLRALGKRFDRAAARDLSHEVAQEFIEDAREQEDFFNTAFRIRPYVESIADNKMCDLFRRERARKKGDDAYRAYLEQEQEGEAEFFDMRFASNKRWQRNSSQGVADQIAAVALQTLKEMPEKRQTAWRLRHEDEKTAKEVADIMGVSVNTVRTHLRLALLDLRRAVEAAGLLIQNGTTISMLPPGVQANERTRGIRTARENLAAAPPADDPASTAAKERTSDRTTDSTREQR